MTDRNPQATEMADESMVRNLTAQAEAIWPQELPLVRRYQATDILDVGCGTGEITLRLATEFPAAQITGIDLVESHLDLAHARSTHGGRVRFQAAERPIRLRAVAGPDLDYSP